MNITNRLNKHFAAAAVVAAATAGSANAAIVYSGVIDITIPLTNSGVYFNVETGVRGPSGAMTPGWDFNPYGTEVGRVLLYAPYQGGYMRNPDAGSNVARTNLSEGTEIGAASYFYTSSEAKIGTEIGHWSANSTGILGFKFKTADGLQHYGWARMALGANAASRIIVDFGYESDAGGSIAAGATGVPAPGAIALLGLAGLAGRRRRA